MDRGVYIRDCDVFDVDAIMTITKGGGGRMSWQQESIKRYEERLAREWTVGGERIPPNLIGSDGQYTSQLAQYERTVGYKQCDYLDWSPMMVGQNTREVCGND